MKNIDLVSMDAFTLGWLSDKLKTAPSDALSAGELSRAISDLTSGQIRSLMLELNGASQPSDLSEIVCGELKIFPVLRRVTRAGNDIVLTPKEFDILCFLAKNRGEVFTKEQIYQAVWDAEYLMDDSNIMAFIRKLRKKIEPHPDSPIYILTIWGIGYKFNDRI